MIQQNRVVSLGGNRNEDKNILILNCYLNNKGDKTLVNLIHNMHPIETSFNMWINGFPESFHYYDMRRFYVFVGIAESQKVTSG